MPESSKPPPPPRVETSLFRDAPGMAHPQTRLRHLLLRQVTSHHPREPLLRAPPSVPQDTHVVGAPRVEAAVNEERTTVPFAPDRRLDLLTLKGLHEGRGDHVRVLTRPELRRE